MKIINISVAISSVLTRSIEVEDNFDPNTINLEQLFWKDNQSISKEEQKTLIECIDNETPILCVTDENGECIYN